VTAGPLVGASCAEQLLFLLDNQESHKSIVLILSDDENISFGVMLNRPSAKKLDISIMALICTSFHCDANYPARNPRTEGTFLLGRRGGPVGRRLVSVMAVLEASLATDRATMYEIQK
jgi:putative AlgH/UPF0301 family transcriptional regulator